MLGGKQGSGGMRAVQADPLEAWVDESIQRSQARGYNPHIFISMRERHTTVPAMERIVVASGEIQSGFIRLKHLGMLEWTMEAGILRFPERFTEQARAAAQFRIDHADDPILRAR
jgi:hypothetical protein